jgi:hypothetical protein
MDQQSHWLPDLSLENHRGGQGLNPALRESVNKLLKCVS